VRHGRHIVDPRTAPVRGGSERRGWSGCCFSRGQSCAHASSKLLFRLVSSREGGGRGRKQHPGTPLFIGVYYLFDSKGGRCCASKNYSELFELTIVCTGPGLCVVKNWSSKMGRKYSSTPICGSKFAKSILFEQSSVELEFQFHSRLSKKSLRGVLVNFSWKLGNTHVIGRTKSFSIETPVLCPPSRGREGKVERQKAVSKVDFIKASPWLLTRP
jgi:hypothetical protein